MTNNPFYPPQWQNQQQVPVIVKNYNIQSTGPMDNHSHINHVYEDILPKKELNATMASLGERLTINSFIRSVLLQDSDGEHISLNPESKNSILSYIKFLELNPYSNDMFSNNPYKDLPSNFLIHRSCYPIRFDSRTNSVECARNSVGMNIRIYNLTNSEYEINKTTNKQNSHNSWREINYYNFIKEHIIKPKVSPNFVLMHAYYISQDSNIDFKKLRELRTGKQESIEPSYIKEEELGKDKIKESDRIKLLTKKLESLSISKPMDLPSSIPEEKQAVVKNPDRTSGKVIVSLTESPNNTIFSWASKLYERTGNIKRMISTGYHNENVWYNILFQMISALYVLQLNNISFEDYQLEHFVYIKDIKLTSDVTNYWKYIIDNKEYYVPNYGYIVLIDTNYKDIKKSSESKDCKKYKINAEFLESSDQKKNAFNSFIKSISPNIWGKTFITMGGTRMPEPIRILLTKMYQEAIKEENINIGYYLSKYFRKYLNNRIGTYLTTSEIEFIRKTDAKNFKDGDIIVHETNYDTYKFVMWNDQKILTKENIDDHDIIEKRVSKGNLFKYSNIEKITQKFKQENGSLNEDDIIEIYKINQK
jgi:hypothetical protein